MVPNSVVLYTVAACILWHVVIHQQVTKRVDFQCWMELVTCLLMRQQISSYIDPSPPSLTAGDLTGRAWWCWTGSCFVTWVLLKESPCSFFLSKVGICVRLAGVEAVLVLLLTNGSRNGCSHLVQRPANMNESVETWMHMNGSRQRTYVHDQFRGRPPLGQRLLSFGKHNT
jgi:hypothetical protein